MISNPLYWGTKLAMAIIIGFNAFHLTRTIGGDPLLAWCLAGAIVIGVFCLDGLIAAILVDAKNFIGIGIAVVIAIGSLSCHWFLYKASAAAFAVADHQTIQKEVNNSEQAHNQLWQIRSIQHQIASAKDEKLKAKLNDDLASAMNQNIEAGQTAKEKGLAAVGQNVGTMSNGNAALMELVAILLGLANGAWLATQIRRGDDDESGMYMYEPTQPAQAKTMKQEEAELKVSMDIDDMMQERHPAHDNTPGYKRRADKAEFNQQYQHAIVNASEATTINKIKEVCGCGQGRASQIKNRMISEGVWKGRGGNLEAV